MEDRKPRIKYTPKQGQYLAFIYYYSKLNGISPAEADIQRHFKVTAPVVHDMVVRLERNGFIEKRPNEPRSIRILIPKEELPDIE